MPDKPTHGRYPLENPKADPDTPINYAKLMVTIKKFYKTQWGV